MHFFTIQSVIIIFLIDSYTANVADFSQHNLDEFTSELEDHERLFIQFYTPHCPYCRSFLSKFHKILIHNNNDDYDNNIKLAMVDCSSRQGLIICKYFNITTYPTLRLFNHGVWIDDFKDTRKLDVIRKWLEKKSILSIHCNTIEELNYHAQNSKDSVILGIFANYDQIWKQWLNTVKNIKKMTNFKDLLFIHMFKDYEKHNRILTLLDIKENITIPSVMIIQPKWLQTNQEPYYLIYNYSYSINLTSWIASNIHGSVALLKHNDDLKSLKCPAIIAYYDYDFFERSSFSHKWRNLLIDYSKRWPSITFLIGHSQNNLWFNKLNISKDVIKIPKNDEDPLFISYKTINKYNHIMFKYNIKLFNKIIHDLIHDTNYNKKTYISTINDLKSDDLDNKKFLTDILIIFYFPHCIECIRWLNKLEKLKKLLIDAEKKLLFGKVDLTKFDYMDKFIVNLSKYPLIYLITSTSNIPYENGDSINSLIEFIRKYTKYQFKIDAHKDEF